MLRLPAFTVTRPGSLEEAVGLLVEYGDRALVVAGGTDLVPNMKHGLFEPEILVALAGIPSLRGVRRTEDGGLAIGAMTSLTDVARDGDVRASAPALAQACSLIAGPQLRNMGTLGGNVMLDTRCQWYNQTHFWRKALGYCLKKDGSLCHVVAGGQKCVAAASNDSAPALMTLGARLAIRGPDGEREVAIDDFWTADGIYNKKLAPTEILHELRLPPLPTGHRGAYGKLRDRGSIDFPLLGVAARLDLDGERIEHADLVVTALQARPLRLRKASAALIGAVVGEPGFEKAVVTAAAAAHRQCHPLANIPGDHDYRREMVPVYVRRTVHAAAAGDGPVHHL